MRLSKTESIHSKRVKKIEDDFKRLWSEVLREAKAKKKTSHLDQVLKKLKIKVEEMHSNVEKRLDNIPGTASKTRYN